MRRWLCRHGLHAWDLFLYWERVTVHRKCVRKGCGAVMTTYWN